MTRVEIWKQTTLSLAILFALGSLNAAAQQKNAGTTAPASKATQPSKAAATENTPSGPHEGVTVHGHWSIEIRNPDGSVASHTEFENALVAGTPVLGDVLGRAAVIGRWSVILLTNACSVNSTQANCDIEEAGGSIGPCGGGTSCIAQTFPNLTVSNAGGTGTTIFQGTATATNASTITGVQTWVTVCPRTTSGYGLPASCGDSLNANSVVFTAATLGSAIQVAAGQIVQVKVTLSFS